jgi:hypothetical protein
MNDSGRTLWGNTAFSRPERPEIGLECEEVHVLSRMMGMYR